MRSRRNDIRVSRKFVPSNAHASNKSRKARVNQLKKPKNETAELSLSKPTIAVKRSENDKNGSLPGLFVEGSDVHKARSPKPLCETSADHSKLKRKVVDQRRDDADYLKASLEQKRRRSGAQNYINKRFLYDVVEPPKRTRQKKMNFAERSTAALMAVSSANLIKRNKTKNSAANHLPSENDFLFYLRSRRGRRLKPKLEYSPTPSINEVPSDEVGYFDEKRNCKRKPQSRSLKSRLSSDYLQWPRNKQSIKNHQSVNHNNDGSSIEEHTPLKYAENTCLQNYSDVLLHGLDVTLQGAPHTDSNSEPRSQTNNSLRLDSSKSKNRLAFRHSIVQDDIQKDSSDPYLRQSLFAPSDMSPTDESHSQDILDFCTGTHSGQFERITNPEEMVGQEDDVESNESRNLSNRQVQQSQDELEEDLLAPELSILAGSATVASADGLLVSSLSDTGTVVATSVSGSSRRKSPVRPMQVLRTKTASAAVSLSSQSTVLGSTADGSSYIFTPPVVPNNVVYTRRLSDTELDHGDDLLSSVLSSAHSVQISDAQQFTDNSVKDTGQLSSQAPVVRMTNFNHGDITVRSHHVISTGSPNSTNILTNVPVCVDGGSGTTNTGLLPSLLSHGSTRSVSQQPVLSRVFVTNGSARPVTTVTTKSIASVPHINHTSVSTRRRPTILKRTLGSANHNLLVSAREAGYDIAETKSDLSVHPPVSRTIGLFTTSSNQIQKTNTVDDPASMNTAPSTASTKLLQLVTTPTLPANQVQPNLTASDRLFGKRPTNYNKSSILSNTLPASPITHSGGNETRTLSTNATTNTPYRYAVVRGSADGRQYVLISSPRLVDQPIHDSIPLNKAVTNSVNGSHIVHTSVADENFNSDNIFPLDHCLSGAFKVEINGAHLLREQSEANDPNNEDRQVHTIFTTTPGTTPLAAT